MFTFNYGSPYFWHKVVLTKFISGCRMVWDLIWCASLFYKSKTEKVTEGRKSAILPNCCCLLFKTVLSDPPCFQSLSKVGKYKLICSWVWFFFENWCDGFDSHSLKEVVTPTAHHSQVEWVKGISQSFLVTFFFFGPDHLFGTRRCRLVFPLCRIGFVVLIFVIWFVYYVYGFFSLKEVVTPMAHHSQIEWVKGIFKCFLVTSSWWILCLTHVRCQLWQAQ